MNDRGSARGHEGLPHTADVGIRAWGPTPAAAFEEAALALGELTAELASEAAVVRPRTERIDIESRELIALAYAWLNELVGLIDLDGALRRVRIDVTERAGGTWHLRGSAAFVPFDGQGVRRRADVKSATYHELSIAEEAGTWTMTAYLDV